MKNLFLVLTLVSVQGMAMTAFPNGKWAGRGVSIDPEGKEATMRETLVIKDNLLHWTETVGEATQEHKLQATFVRGGHFTGVYVETNEKFHGYCVQTSCHLQSDDGKFEMAMIFERNNIREVGSVTVEGKVATFESMMLRTIGE